jgi:hypothetical protein
MGVVYFVASFFRLSQYSAVWIFNNFAVEYYHAVRKLPMLRGAPYNPNIYSSHLFNFALVFMISKFPPFSNNHIDYPLGYLERFLPYCKSPLSIYRIHKLTLPQFVFIAFVAALGLKEQDAPRWEISCGLIDFTHALFMLVAARVQQKYLPDQSWLGNCTEAYSWGISDGEPSFYTLISITVDNGNMTQSGATEQCYVYQYAWYIEAAMGYDIIRFLAMHIC